MQLAPSLKGELKSVRVYGRYLRTSEAVGNYQAGLTDDPDEDELAAGLLNVGK